MEMDWSGAGPEDADLLGLISDAVADEPSFVADWGQSLYAWRTVDTELDALLRSTADEQTGGAAKVPPAP